MIVEANELGDGSSFKYISSHNVPSDQNNNIGQLARINKRWGHLRSVSPKVVNSSEYYNYGFIKFVTNISKTDLCDVTRVDVRGAKSQHNSFIIIYEL